MSRIFVGRLSHQTSEDDLYRSFERYGKVGRLSLKKGYAFVDFEDARDAQDAMRDMDGRDLDGSRIVCESAKGVAHPSGGGREGGGGGGGRPGKYFPEYSFVGVWIGTPSP